MKKIVLLGGSFNPVHYGHINMLKMAVKQLNADQGWFLVANQAPQKEQYSVSFNQRCKWIKYIIKGFKRLKVCEIEKELPLPNYTYNTINVLKHKYPDYKFIFLIGSDQAKNISNWYNIESLYNLVDFVVYSRDQQIISGFNYILGDDINISSSEIRRGTKFLTHPKILSEIMEYGYYAEDRLNTVSMKRKQHILSVSNFILSLAPYNYNYILRLRLYGLGIGHDQYKEDASLFYLTDFEKSLPVYLHHAFKIRNVASKKYYVKNKKFLNSLAYHVCGNSVNQMAMLLFVADKLEPLRKYDTGWLLRLVKNDLYHGFIKTREESLKYNG